MRNFFSNFQVRIFNFPETFLTLQVGKNSLIWIINRCCMNIMWSKWIQSIKITTSDFCLNECIFTYANVLEDEKIITDVNLLVFVCFVRWIDVDAHVWRGFVADTAADLAWSSAMLDVGAAKEIKLITNSSLLKFYLLFLHFRRVKIQ